MPRNKTTRICGAKDIECYNSAEYDILNKEIVEEMEKSSNEFDVGGSCNCLPVCNSIEYEADVTHVVFDWKEYIRASQWPEKNKLKTNSLIFLWNYI